MHARREATFLVLAGTFLVAAATMPVLGMSRIIDLSGLLPDVDLPADLLLPVGVLAFPLSFTAAALVCEIWGRKRATAMVWVGLFLQLALLGLLAVVDSIPDAAGQTTDSVAPALGFIACAFVAHMFHAQAYHALRRQSRSRHLWLRRNVAALIAAVAGWVIFALVLYTHAVQVAELSSDQAAQQVAAFALAGGLCTLAGALVDTVPLVLVSRALTVFLRVGRSEALDEGYAEGPTAGGVSDSAPRMRREALVVETPAPPPRMPPPPPGGGAGRVSGAFSTSEKRFFTEGDELETSDAGAADSLTDVPARGGQSA
ncbi:MAG TPA: VUT family protein [Kofleriaceae bacterium]|nr:VUT family protein [Kofleriaceae bacterium]